MRFVSYRCGVVHVARCRLPLGTRQMATRTYDVRRWVWDILALKIYIGRRRQSIS